MMTLSLANKSYKKSANVRDKMTDAEVIELLKEIKRLKDYVKTLANHNKRIIKQNKELQQELKRLTNK